MQLDSDVQIRDGLLAENTPLSEKPRLGFERTETTVHRASIRLNYLNGNRVSSTVAFEGRPVSLMAQQQPITIAELTTILYNETSSFSPNPNAQPMQPGSAEDLFNARVGVAEAILNLFKAGPVKIGVTVAFDRFSDQALAAFKAHEPSSMKALSGSMEAAEKAYAGSDYMHGAKQYRTRTDGDVTGNLGRTSKNPGTPLTAHFGPFKDSMSPSGNGVVVIAP